MYWEKHELSWCFLVRVLILVVDFFFVEGSTTGRLSWRFDLASGAPHLAILLVVVSCPGAAFEDGRLTWQLSTSDHRHTLPNGQPTSNRTVAIIQSYPLPVKSGLVCLLCFVFAGCVDHEVEMCGSRWCELSVDLDGGRGAQAWQHAQVGRQSTDDRLAFLWRLRVLFGDVD